MGEHCGNERDSQEIEKHSEVNGKETEHRLKKIICKIMMSKILFFLFTKSVSFSIDIMKIYVWILAFDRVVFDIVDICLELKDY